MIVYSQMTEKGPQLLDEQGPLPDRIFLHLCCGPCTEWPLEYLRAHGIEPEGYFYNPNIHPLQEWERRLEGLHQLAHKKQFQFQVDEGSEEELWLSMRDRVKQQHCAFCYGRRFFKAAQKAAEAGYEGFSSTLLVSPYQNRSQMLQIGRQAAERFGLRFYAFDFRPGYEKGQRMAREDGLYRQRFCGCIYSLGESAFAAKIAPQLGRSPESLPRRQV